MKNERIIIAGRNVNLVLTTATLAAMQIGAGVIQGGSEQGAQSGIWPGMWYGIGCGGGLVLAGLLAASKLRTRGGFVPLDFFGVRYGERRWVRVWAWLSNIPGLQGIFVAQIMAAGSVAAAGPRPRISSDDGANQKESFIKEIVIPKKGMLKIFIIIGRGLGYVFLIILNLFFIFATIFQFYIPNYSQYFYIKEGIMSFVCQNIEDKSYQEAFEIISEYLEKKYPYFEYKNIDWEKIKREAQEKVKPVNERPLKRSRFSIYGSKGGNVSLSYVDTDNKQKTLKIAIPLEEWKKSSPPIVWKYLPGGHG